MSSSRSRVQLRVERVGERDVEIQGWSFALGSLREEHSRVAKRGLRISSGHSSRVTGGSFTASTLMPNVCTPDSSAHEHVSAHCRDRDSIKESTEQEHKEWNDICTCSQQLPSCFNLHRCVEMNSYLSRHCSFPHHPAHTHDHAMR